MSLDPENCPHCGASWVGELLPEHLREGPDDDRRCGGAFVLMIDDDDRPLYYQCRVCDAKTPLTIWNRGYKNEFLAEVFMRGILEKRDG